jgi:tetratricopeptide (TPR) repeat protein
MLAEETLERLALDFEVGLFECFLETDPDHVAALEALAAAYSRAGRRADAVRVDRRLVALLPGNALAFYNLACSLSLAGEVGAALDALEQALALGYRDFEFLAKDPDLANVREDARYRSLIAG